MTYTIIVWPKRGCEIPSEKGLKELSLYFLVAKDQKSHDLAKRVEKCDNILYYLYIKLLYVKLFMCFIKYMLYKKNIYSNNQKKHNLFFNFKSL